MIRSVDGSKRTLLSTAAIVVVVVSIAMAPSADASAPCRPWKQTEAATGLGVLENLAFDDKGGLLLSAWQHFAVERMTPDGKLTTVVSGIRGPGGMVVVGDTLWLNTGNSPDSGIVGRADGTIDKVDLRTGARQTWASGLVMPNGLALLPGGGALVSRDFGSPTGLTRLDAAGHATGTWAEIPKANGIVVEPGNKAIYVSGANGQDAVIWRVNLDDPKDTKVAGRLGSDSSLGLDDMTVDRHGVLYVAA